MAGQDLITVKLQTITDVKYEVRVRPTESILELKNQLAKRHDIKNKIQLMMNKEELKDSLQIERYGIEAGSVLQMLLIPAKDIKITFYVFKKDTVTLDATDHHTVADLRKELLKEEYKLGVSPKILDYYFDAIKLDMDKPLYEYGVAGDCEISLHHVDSQFRINVMVYDELFLVPTKVTDTVKDFKDRVLRKINSGREETEKISECNSLILFHRSKDKPDVFTELDCERVEMRLYMINHEDIIICLDYSSKYRSMQRSNIKVDGRPRCVSHLPSEHCERVLEFKLKVQDQLGIPFHRQVISDSRDILDETACDNPSEWSVKIN